MQHRPRRSALYMPGSNARAIEKARTLAADCVILDLEDSVSPDAKAVTRAHVAAAVLAGGFGRREVAIRVNALDTPWGADDLAAAAAAGPDAVLVPKIAGPDDVRAAQRLLASAPAKTKLWLMMELPLAILSAREIAAVAKEPGARLSLFVMGTNDLVKETGASLDANRTAALYWLSASVTAARAFGLEILDGVYNDFKDTDGFRRECQHGRMLGMDGKTLIHPGQIEIANEVFAPPPAEVAWSRKIIAAFELPENRGKAAISVDGKMVELLHADIARRTVAIADAISAIGS